MALPALATQVDLEARLGHTVDADRAAALLVDASATVRRYVRQQISRVVDDTVTVRVDRGRVVLPERPAEKPTQIVRADTGWVIPPAAWWWTGVGAVELFSPTWVGNGPTPGFRDSRLHAVTVTYTHGYEEIPQEIVKVVCQMVGRVIDGAFGSPGLRQEVIDDYTAMAGGSLVSGTVALVPEEKEDLEPFRVRRGSIRTTAGDAGWR
jgi:hypothetical protein